MNHMIYLSILTFRYVVFVRFGNCMHFMFMILSVHDIISSLRELDLMLIFLGYFTEFAVVVDLQ